MSELSDDEKKEMEKKPDQPGFNEFDVTVIFLGVPRSLEMRLAHKSSPKAFIDGLKEIQEQLKGKDLGRLVPEATLRGVWKWMGKRLVKQLGEDAIALDVRWTPEKVAGDLAEFQATPERPSTH